MMKSAARINERVTSVNAAVKSGSLVTVLALLLYCSPLPVSAAQLEFSSSLNPVGSGARATGIGGAFIAVADDATAASWNPAGLINLEKPEFSLVYSYFNRSQSYTSLSNADVNGTSQSMDAAGINYASIAYPFEILKHNVVVTLNYQRLYDMNKKLSLTLNNDLGDGDFKKSQVVFKQDGYLGAFSPAIAIQILPELYFGTTLNIWNDFAGTSHWQSSLASPARGVFNGLPFSETTNVTSKYTFSGLNAHFGLLYSPSSRFTLGLVYKTQFHADITKNMFGSVSQTFPDDPNSNSRSHAFNSEKLRMTVPASYGVGFAYRHSDKLTFALDLYRTEWSKLVLTDAAGNQTNPITTKPLLEGRSKDTIQVRLGSEYLFIGDNTVIPVRAGLFYDPEPNGTKLDDYYGFSLGTGIAYNKYIFDISYQYRFGNNTGSDLPNSGITSDVKQHTVMTSLIYHFK